MDKLKIHGGRTLEGRVEIAGQAIGMLELLTELMCSLRVALEHSSLHASKGESLEIMLGVPANANGAVATQASQRRLLPP